MGTYFRIIWITIQTLFKTRKKNVSKLVNGSVNILPNYPKYVYV